MPRTKRKTKKKRSREKDTPEVSLNPMRTGMPAQDSITGVKEFKKYRVIQTREIDEYEEPPRKKSRKRSKTLSRGV